MRQFEKRWKKKKGYKSNKKRQNTHTFIEKKQSCTCEVFSTDHFPGLCLNLLISDQFSLSWVTEMLHSQVPDEQRSQRANDFYFVTTGTDW
jgi:hypothetical protein